MSRLSAVSVLLMLLVAVLTSPEAGAYPPRPKPQELIERWVEVSGGTTRYEQITGRLERWTMSLGPKRGTMETRADTMGRFITTKQRLGDNATMSEGGNGVVAWRIGWDETAVVLPTSEMEIMQIITDPAWPLHPDRYMQRMVIPGQEWFGEEACWQIVGLLDNKQRVELFFSTRTGHWRGLEYILRGEDTWTRMQLIYDDYQLREGILTPHAFSAGDGRITVTGTLDQFEWNPELSPVAFALPEAVKEILPAEPPANAPGDAAASSSHHQRLIDMIGPSLVDAEARNVPSAVLRDKDAVLLYFSAAWCPPCRAFTPTLVEFARAHASPKNFAVIFVSSDRSEAAMRKYMKDYRMDFYAVPLSRVAASRLGDVYGDRGIPNLVWLNTDDEVVGKSYVDGTYVGPRKVLGEFAKALGIN